MKEARITWDLPGLEYGGLHNIYFQIITVNGVISLILFLAFLCGMLIFILKRVDNLKKRKIKNDSVGINAGWYSSR